MKITPSSPKAVTGSGVVFAGPTALRGWSIRETAGAAAVVRIWDHASAASGVRLASVSLAANGSSTAMDPAGVSAALGLYFEVVSGTVEGTVWVS